MAILPQNLAILATKHDYYPLQILATSPKNLAITLYNLATFHQKTWLFYPKRAPILAQLLTSSSKNLIDYQVSSPGACDIMSFNDVPI